jgi:hypothetical protein
MLWSYVASGTYDRDVDPTAGPQPGLEDIRPTRTVLGV